VGLSHLGMACSRVVGGGMVSGTEGSCEYMNKHWRRAEKGWSSSFVGRARY
jgi:hypothetical protein